MTFFLKNDIKINCNHNINTAHKTVTMLHNSHITH